MIVSYKNTKHITALSLRMIFLSLIAVFTCQSANAALTAQQVAQKAAAVVAGAKGITASFTISSDGHSTKGTIKGSGVKFTVTLPEVSTWYDGKSLYTYNPRTQETTVTNPTARELLESNPLLYVKGGSVGYTYSFARQKAKGKYIVDLFPRDKRSGLKKLTFTINASSFIIEKIAVTASGMNTVVTVNSLKTGAALPASTFVYPRSKYPGVEIVDLR